MGAFEWVLRNRYLHSCRLKFTQLRSHINKIFVCCWCRYGCRTSSSASREKAVDDEDEDDEDEDEEDEREKIFFVWPSSLDYLPFDLLSIGNGPAAVPFSHGRKFLLPLLQGRGD